MTIEQILDYKLSKLLSSENYNLVTLLDKNFVLAQAKTKIQSYCHRIDIPVEAFYVWADMAIEILKGLNNSLFTKATTEELMDRVTSVKAGDTTLSFSELKEGPKEESNSVGDSMLDAFSKQLQVFRKFPKGNGCGTDGV